MLFKLIGYKNASNLGSKIGIIFGKFIRSDKIIHKNISLISENSNFRIENKNKIVKDVFSNYGRILAEYVFLKNFRNGNLNNYINITGKNYLEDIKKNKKKAIFISGHFNNFELMAMLIDSAGVNLAAIYRPLNNIFLNKIMEYMRKKYICKFQIKKGKVEQESLLNT